jgi:hypothetical protein
VAAPGAQLVGLNALARDAGRLCAHGGALDNSLSQAGRTVLEPVAAQTRSSYPSVSGTLAASVTVTTSRSGAAVRVEAIYAGPVDFGGWPPGRDYVASGRYLFPAGEQADASAVDAYGAATQRALDGFAWTNATTSAESVHD